ncbi:HSD17B8 [Branchiostoma lanceolatum]|uniref:HSD17B8 protein n=1 Tax=Branchiostoma lanceolatum TaxID=7740 RepID=A0A8K0AEE7_BRALA|nr:HSD17B8 [Branchiostoma lanceolatum]
MNQNDPNLLEGTGRLSGKFALVTGGGSGIGRAACQVFAREGATVAVVDINDTGAEETVQSLPKRGPYPHKSYVIDVTSADAISRLVESVRADYSVVPDVILASQGVQTHTAFLDMDEETFDKIISVNLKGTFLVVQAFSRLMVESKVPGGSIITMGSLRAAQGSAFHSHYAASKGGIVSLTKSVALELAKFNIRCNVVNPGAITTPLQLQDFVPEGEMPKRIQAIPLRRYGDPIEVANLCLFLASDESSYMTGQAVDITGGR